MTDSTNPIPPVLTYAEASTNALPEWFEAVERMLDAREPVWNLAAMFPTSMDAVNYVIQSLARRFPLQNVGSNCESCGQPCSTAAMVYWRVRVAAKRAEVVRSTNSMPSESSAVTHHAMCPACHQVSYSRKSGQRWLSHSGLVLIIASFVVGSLMMIRQNSDEPSAVMLLTIPGIIMVAMSASRTRCNVSPAIYSRMPVDVVPVAVGQLFDRSKGGTP